MTFHDLISQPEFWAALFGALAAFLLGAVATWSANMSARRTAGNLTLVTLSQMYGLMENIRQSLFVAEPRRYLRIAGVAPYSFQLRSVIGVSQQHMPRVPFDQLGFLADTDDPDILNRLLTAERAFVQMLDIVNRHERLTAELSGKLNALDPTGQRPLSPAELIAPIGAKFFIEIDDAVEGLRKGLPETRDAVLSVGRQLRDILRMRYPARRFLGFSPEPRKRSISDLPPSVAAPQRWRVLVRRAVDTARNLWWAGRRRFPHRMRPFPRILTCPPLGDFRLEVMRIWTEKSRGFRSFYLRAMRIKEAQVPFACVHRFAPDSGRNGRIL